MGEAEGHIVDDKRRVISSHESTDVQNDQSSDTQKAKKKKKTRSEECNESGDATHAETLPVPLLSKKHNSKNVCGERIHKVSWKGQPESEGSPAISDARLRAYGINPKKYKNKLKYGKQATFGDVRQLVQK
jgi:protein KRI1